MDDFITFLLKIAFLDNFSLLSHNHDNSGRLLCAYSWGVLVGFSGLAGCTLKRPPLENIWPPALRSQWGSRPPIGQKIVIACHWLLQYWIWFQDTVLWKLKIYEKWIFLMKNVERLKIHNEGMKIHKISIENTFSYCILVSLGAPPAVVPQTHAFCRHFCLKHSPDAGTL